MQHVNSQSRPLACCCVSVALLKLFMQPVTIADTDSPRLLCVLEQMEKRRREGRKESSWKKKGKKNADLLESIQVT